MSDVRYMVGTFGEDLSKPLGLQAAKAEIHQFLDHPKRDYHMKRKGSPWGTVRNGKLTKKRFNEIVPTLKVGDALLIQNVRSKETKVVRVLEVELQPANTTGTPGIDLIWAAVFEEFDQKYGITNLGICANKPGQHGKCNAWDIGVSKPSSADAIHAAIRDIANWLRNNARSKGLGLPLNGIIVMYEWCEQSGDWMTGWQAYHGTPHVTHVHLSATPSLVPGWI